MICRSSAMVALCLGAFLLAPALADGPITLTEYRFLPNVSTLNLSGGFASIDADLEISGALGLAQGFESEFPSLEPFAEFVFVDALATDEVFELDLDSALNLTGLEGTFDPTEPQDLFFSGVEGQGNPMQVQVHQQGRRIRLTGTNSPGCCDMFSYSLDAVAIRRPSLSGLTDTAATGMPQAVPEPFAFPQILLALGIGILAGRRRR